MVTCDRIPSSQKEKEPTLKDTVLLDSSYENLEVGLYFAYNNIIVVDWHDLDRTN